MKKRMRLMISQRNSKKGMSLVELVVGITIIVVVFGATLSAMMNSFANTVYNADMDKTAVGASSVNELMMEAAVKKMFSGADDVNAMFTNGQPNDSNTVHTAALTVIPEMEYVLPNQFPQDGVDNQYTIVTDAKSTTSRLSSSSSIKGITIRTLVRGSNGTLYNESFVAYTMQPQT